MEKKRFKYFRVLVNQKGDRKQKSFLEKYKDSISSISSLCTVATVMTAIITFSAQFWNSHQAANFYQIEQHYFFQISIWKMLFDTIKLVLIKIIGWILPVVAFSFISFYKKEITYSLSREKETSQSDKILMASTNLVPYVINLGMCFIYTLVSPLFLSLEERQMISQLPVWIYSIYFFVWFSILSFIIINDVNHKIYKRHRVYCIAVGICLGFYSVLGEFHDDDWQSLVNVFFALYYIIIQWAFSYKGKESNGLVILGIFICAVMAMILLFEPYYRAVQNFWNNPYAKKNKYEIVQSLNHFSSDNKVDIVVSESDLENNEENILSDSNLQVVILHTGSQILLMNGTINDRGFEIKSPKDITSSSNLFLDISSYEIQNADKYSFHWRSFASVKRKYGDYLLDKDDEEKNNTE